MAANRFWSRVWSGVLVLCPATEWREMDGPGLLLLAVCQFRAQLNKQHEANTHIQGQFSFCVHDPGSDGLASCLVAQIGITTTKRTKVFGKEL